MRHLPAALLLAVFALSGCGDQESPDQPYYERLSENAPSWQGVSHTHTSDWMDDVCRQEGEDPPAPPDGVTEEDWAYAVGLVLGSERCSR